MQRRVRGTAQLVLKTPAHARALALEVCASDSADAVQLQIWDRWYGRLQLEHVYIEERILLERGHRQRVVAREGVSLAVGLAHRHHATARLFDAVALHRGEALMHGRQALIEVARERRREAVGIMRRHRAAKNQRVIVGPEEQNTLRGAGITGGRPLEGDAVDLRAALAGRLNG